MVRLVANLEKIVAREVADGVHERAEILAERAERLLAAHRHSGRASIEVTRGRTDSWVSLVDPDGGALSIEYGRGPTSERGPMQGLYILHRMIGMRGG